MVERPILFNGAMVRAILAGQKTVTRRAVKFPFIDRAYGCELAGNEIGSEAHRLCPYGKPGDRLWVRETFTVESNRYADEPYSAPHKDGRPIKRYEDEKWDQPHYRATDQEPELWYDDKDGPSCRWKPSIHMPRWVSRILLEVTDVRVERLHDITEEQARAEGITDGGCLNCGNHEPCGCECPAPCAVDSFVHLWNSTGGNWDANPWVWVVEFKILMPQCNDNTPSATRAMEHA